jgi:hypothetical protein
VEVRRAAVLAAVRGRGRPRHTGCVRRCLDCRLTGRVARGIVCLSLVRSEILRRCEGGGVGRALEVAALDEQVPAVDDEHRDSEEERQRNDDQDQDLALPTA